MWESLRGLLNKYTETFLAKTETFLANTSDLETQQKAMHHVEIKLNVDASCQQILGLELEILWEARSTPTLTAS
jgi:hypothetical protein